jgi:hypothetical protein
MALAKCAILWISWRQRLVRGERASGVGAGAVTTDLSYYRRRASEERTAALNSRDPRVRRVHAEMAEHYEDRVRAMTAHHEQIFVEMTEHV